MPREFSQHVRPAVVHPPPPTPHTHFLSSLLLLPPCCRTPEEFSQHVRHALAHEPHPMRAEDRERLTWEAATERFLDVSELSPRDLHPSRMAAAVDNLAWVAHNTLVGMEGVRAVTGAGAHTRDNLQRVTDYQPREADVGGLFDNKSRARKAHGLVAAK